MSYFNIELIRKIKSINAIALATTEILGIFKDREISIDGNIITWFNASPGQYGDLLYYLEFQNGVNDELIYGTYTIGMFGVKTKIQIGSFALNEDFNFFSMTAPNNLIHISLEDEMYKDIKCTYTDNENKTRYENKIFKFTGVNENGSVNYTTQVGEELLLFFDYELHKWFLRNSDDENFGGVETNDNSLYLLTYSDVSNAFNDYFQFAPFVFISSNSGSGKGKGKR